jgi:hypothetical protein
MNALVIVLLVLTVLGAGLVALKARSFVVCLTAFALLAATIAGASILWTTALLYSALAPAAPL